MTKPKLSAASPVSWTPGRFCKTIPDFFEKKPSFFKKTLDTLSGLCYDKATFKEPVPKLLVLEQVPRIERKNRAGP
jgi:hypothetical protein